MSLLGQALANAAGNTAQGAVGIGMQRLGANYDRRMQVKQQMALMKGQIAGEKEMMDYQNMKQLEFWNKTSYGAQLANMKAAGLSPGLMYGGGPGAGGTTGSGVPSVGSASAQYNDTAGKGMDSMGLMNVAQLRLIEAQKQNIDADTQNKLSENPNIPKTGKKLDAETENIIANTGNTKVDTTLKKAQARITEIQGNVAEQSQDSLIRKIYAETNRAIDDAHIVMNEAHISDETIKAKISILKTEAINKILESALIKAQTANTTQNTASQKSGTEQNIRKIAADIAQGWDSNRITESNNMMRNAIESAGIDLKNQDQIIDAIRDIIGLGLLTSKGGGGSTPIKGFHNR